jgi:hypothetical protein
MAVVLTALGVIIAPTAASAASPTSIGFETPGPVEVDFAQDWLLVLTVSAVFGEGASAPLSTRDGTVDVYLSGIEGVFAPALPIQSDGRVYVSQPAAQALLPAGTYNARAVFSPVAGGGYSSSQTVDPIVLTIAPTKVAATVEVLFDPSVSERPIISAGLEGASGTSLEGAPAGTWHFTLIGVTKDVIFETDAAQPHGATDALRIEVTSPLLRNEPYTLRSTFTPVAELAGGVTVEPIPDATFETSGDSASELLNSPAPIPLWLAISLLAVLLGLVAVSITLGVRLAGRPPRADTESHPQVASGREGAADMVQETPSAKEDSA